MRDDPEILLRLPADMRGELKEPLGSVHTDISELLTSLDGPIVAVGDVVSHDCETLGRSPDVAVIDGRTKRSAVDPEIKSRLAGSGAARLEAVNPAGTITRSLLDGLVEAMDRSESVQLVVDGEEDLAALPAVLGAPDHAHVLYGQPDEGVVHVRVDEDARDRVRTLLGAMEGDTEKALQRLTA